MTISPVMHPYACTVATTTRDFSFKLLTVMGPQWTCVCGYHACNGLAINKRDK